MTARNESLSGLKVLDLSQFIPGPYATRLLADQGAEVIKVEPPRGDPMRTLLYRGARDADRLSPVYQAINRGKRIVCLDLKANHDRQKLIHLARDADVLLESFRPGVMTRLRLDWQLMRAENPQLIYCSLSGYGQQGRYREQVGHDINYCAAAGMYSPSQLTPPTNNQSSSKQSPHAKPAFAFPPIADHVSAMLAVNTILAALYARCQHGGGGDGRYLDISIYESMLAFRYLSNISASGADIGHVDFIGGNAACYHIYATADHRFITLGAVEEKFWRVFCEAMHEPSWLARQYDAFPQRALIAAVQARFSEQPLQHWNAKLLNVECCYEPVPLDHEVLQHPQTVDRQLAVEHDIRYPAWLDGRPSARPKPLELVAADAALGWRSRAHAAC